MSIIASCDWQREQPDLALQLLVLSAHHNVSIYFLYTLWKRIESFNEYYLIFYWMLLLLLSEVYNTTIFLMVSLNGIDGKNRWSSYTATLLSLILATNNRPIWFVLMAWNCWCGLASRKTKPLDGTVTSLASISLASASAARLVNCGCVAAHKEEQWHELCAREPPHCLCNRYTYFRAHRSLLPIAQSPIRLIVVRSSTSSLTSRLSRGAWAPAKSGGDCWYNLHVPLSDVQTQ